MFVEA